MHEGPFRHTRLSRDERMRHGSVQDLFEQADAPDAVFHQERQKRRQGVFLFRKREEGFEGAEDPEEGFLVGFVRGIVTVEIDDLAPATQLGRLPDQRVDVERAAQDNLRLAPVGDGLQKVRLVAQHFSRPEMEQVRRLVEAQELHFFVGKKIFEGSPEGVFGGPSRQSRLFSGERSFEPVRILDLELCQNFVLFEEERFDVRFPTERFVSGDQFEIDRGERPGRKRFFFFLPLQAFVDEPPLEAAFPHVGGPDHEKEKRSVP